LVLGVVAAMQKNKILDITSGRGLGIALGWYVTPFQGIKYAS